MRGPGESYSDVMRDSYGVCMTLAAREYDATQDCARLGLHPFLLQMRKYWLPLGAVKSMLRSVHLLPRYLFLPLPEARARQLHHVRGLCGHRYLLASAEGRIWEAPGSAIFEIAKAENEGRFDEVPPELGDRVKLKGGGVLAEIHMVVSGFDDKTARLFSPLLGGARVTAKTVDLTRAA
jgi:hypothetical protein